MRIYSKVSDYYDNVRAFGIDPNCVFVRKERVLNIVGNDKDYDAFNVSPQLKLMIENGNKYKLLGQIFWPFPAKFAIDQTPQNPRSHGARA